MAFQAKVSSKREVKVMQRVKEKIEKKRGFSDETLKVLAMNLNDWGSAKPENVDSVASFFVSRVDTAIDKLLTEIGSKESLDLRGLVAIANCQMIYRRFKDIFYGDTFAGLQLKGARVQRPLWASTSTKNPNYPDVLYVEALSGRNTVNTIPPDTLYDFRDHGVAKKDAVEKGKPEEVLFRLDRLGIDLKTVGEKLQQEGVDSFTLSYKKLLQALEEKRRTL